MEFKSALLDGGKSLKDQTRWLVRSYVLIHAAMLAVVLFGFEPLAAVGRDALSGSIKSIVPTLIGYVFSTLGALVLLGLLPSLWRDRLVHLRWRYPLPGARAFSKFARSDSRVDVAWLERIFGPLPTDPAMQNHLWYRIYREHENELSVLDAHRSYLATRDITAITWIMLPMCTSVYAYNIGWQSTSVIAYAVFMSATAFTLSIGAKMYAARLVENVLAAASTGAITHASNDADSEYEVIGCA